MEEINNYTQDDLEEDDIMILDTYDQVLVWIGKDSNQKERKDAFTFAQVIRHRQRSNVYIYI